VIPVALVLVAAIAAIAVTQRPQDPAPAAPSGPESGQQIRRYPARGQVRPVAYARVGTVTGGVVQELYVETGVAVGEYQELARVQASGAIEIVRAPFAGTVTTVLVRRGDTLAPGATLVNVGDLTRFQVETNDLDEFLIAEVRRGQLVSVLVDALDEELLGQVRSVAIEPTRSATGDDHYPVLIDLLETPAELRPGMNVRIRFDAAAIPGAD
jgi:multidrug efflux pump subunit AcrA (membrane-fusion protein)